MEVRSCISRISVRSIGNNSTESRVLFNSYRVQSDLHAAEANIGDFRGDSRRSGTRGEDRYQRRVQDPARVRALVVDQDPIRHHRRAAQTPRRRPTPRWGEFLYLYFIPHGQLKSSRLVFCSTPVQLLFNSVQHSQVSHVVVDEVHERSLDSDFLLVLLRDVLPHRPSLRVVLMSATLNAAAFSAYFKGAAVAQIPGFTREFIFIYVCAIRD